MMSSMKRHFGLFGVGVFLAAITVLSLSVGVTEVQGGGGRLIISVDVDEFSFVPTNPDGFPGPFSLEGDTGLGPGSYQEWGWLRR